MQGRSERGVKGVRERGASHTASNNEVKNEQQNSNLMCGSF